MKKLITLLFIILSVSSTAQTAIDASDLQNIIISTHPTKGLERRADLVSFYWSAKDSFIQQKYYVYEVDLNGDRDDHSRYEVSLFASNAWLVDPTTGALLMTLEEYNTMPVEDRPLDVMGEYSFFLLYAENPIQLYQLLYLKVLEADLQRKRFDR